MLYARVRLVVLRTTLCAVQVRLPPPGGPQEGFLDPNEAALSAASSMSILLYVMVWLYPLFPPTLFSVMTEPGVTSESLD